MFCKVNYYPGKGVDNEREGPPAPKKNFSKHMSGFN